MVPNAEAIQTPSLASLDPHYGNSNMNQTTFCGAPVCSSLLDDWAAEWHPFLLLGLVYLFRGVTQQLRLHPLLQTAARVPSAGSEACGGSGGGDHREGN